MTAVFKSEQHRKKLLASYDNLLAAWDVDYTEIDLETRYGSTHCITAGNPGQPPLLLFHGVGDNSAVIWMLNIKALAEHFYCIAVDTVGAPGKSVPNDLYYLNFNQVNWISELIVQLGIRKINIAGVSNGAYMAYNFFAKRKQDVRKIVCLEGGMVTRPLKAAIDTLLLVMPEILIPTDRNMKRIFRKLMSPQSAIYRTHPEIIDHIILAMRAHNSRAMFMHKIEEYDAYADAAIRKNMYFLLGDYRIRSKRAFIRILDRGDYPYKIIQGAGHGLNQEQPAVVNAEIIAFLKKKP